MSLLIIIILAIILAPIALYFLSGILGIIFSLIGGMFGSLSSGLDAVSSLKKLSQSEIYAIKINAVLWGGLVLLFVAEFTIVHFLTKV